MKFAIILALLCISATVLAEKAQTRTKLTNLLNMQARAADAVDSALQLLYDLKQANFDSQAAADEVNRTQEANYGKQIADLTFIADANKAAGNEATDRRKWFENEIAVTQEYLVWINNRRKEIHRKRAELQEQRCVSSMMLVKALKEHDEALEVIRWLREDILGIVGGGEEEGAEGVELSQLKDVTQKLSAYKHLFNQQAMKAFNQLTNQEDVDPELQQYDEKASDNEKGQLEVKSMGSGTDDRDVGQKILEAVDKLEQHLKDSIEDLQKNEIQAAWDFVRWLQGSEQELEHLDVEQAAKTTYIDKLLIGIIGAQAHEDRQWEIYFESANTLNSAIDDLNALRAAYMQEKARRDEENEILDGIIEIFKKKVASMDAGIRGKTDDYSGDKQFNDGSDIARKTDTIKEKDQGKLGSNVAAEAAGL